MVNRSLSKSERIYLRDDLRRLFAEGSSFVAYPLRIVFLSSPTPKPNAPLAILISVPKKRFKHAVDRNRIKRLVREAFRLQKDKLGQKLRSQGCSISFAAVYLKNELPDYKTIYRAIGKTLHRLERENITLLSSKEQSLEKKETNEEAQNNTPNESNY